MTSDYDKRRLIEWLRAETARATGRRYQIDFDALDVQSLRELVSSSASSAISTTRSRPQ